jgi:outer membrane protein TolC
VALAKFYAARNALFAEVKRAYFEYALLGESLDIVQAQNEVLKDVEEIVRSRYGLGLSAEADLLRVQTARDKIQDQAKGIDQARPALSAKLAQAVGRDNPEELPRPQPAAFPRNPPAFEEMLARIRAHNPDLTAYQRMIPAREKDLVLAKQAYFPDFSLSFAYGDMRNATQRRNRDRQAAGADAAKTLLEETPTSGLPMALGDIAYDNVRDRFLRETESVRDDYSIAFGMSLPIWYPRIKAGIKEARLLEEAAHADRKRTELTLESAAQDGLYRHRDAQRRQHLYKDVVIPRETQTLDGPRISYDTNAGASFLDLMDSVGVLLAFKLELARADRDLLVACADLEMLMGEPWTESDSAPNNETLVKGAQ